MKNKSILMMVIFIIMMFTESLRALTIDINFTGGVPPTNSLGGGNITNLLRVAADIWELAIQDDYEYSIDCSWNTNGGGDHVLLLQGGVPNRETLGQLNFNDDNDANHFAWYLDPLTNNLFTTYREESTTNLGGGSIVDTRDYTYTNQVIQRTDLLTIAMHEIGHSLGLSYGNYSYQNDSVSGNIYITPPEPFAGMIVPLQHNNAGIVDHIAFMSPTSRTLMSTSPSYGERLLPSELDIVTVAQISQFVNLNLKLFPILKLSQPQIVTIIKGKSTTTKSVMNLSWMQVIPGNVVLQQSGDLINWTTSPLPITNTNIYYYNTVITNAPGQMFFRLVPQPQPLG